MKRLLILLLALMPLSALAQGYKFENNTITYQYIQDTDMSFSELHTAVVASNDFTDIQVLDNRIVAKIKPENYVPEEYGFKWGNSNTLLLNGALGPIAVRIDYKEGRYRITATDIKVTDITPGGVTPKGYQSKLEDYALKKGQPNNMMVEQFGPVFEKFIIRKTTFIKVEDDW